LRTGIEAAKGQESVKRALEIASGGHNLLMLSYIRLLDSIFPPLLV